MTTFNRYFLVLLATAATLFWGGAVFAIWAFPGELTLAFRDLSLLIRLQPVLAQTLVTAFGVSAMAVSLLILVGELFPQEPSIVALSSVQGGTAAITLSALLQGLKQELEQQTGLQAVRPSITSRRDGIDVQVELHAERDAQLSDRAEEVSQAARDLLEGKWGLKVKNVHVTFTSPIGETRAATPRSEGGSPQGQRSSEIVVPALLQTPPVGQGEGERKPPS